MSGWVGLGQWETGKIPGRFHLQQRPTLTAATILYFLRNMEIRGCQINFILCLILRKVFSQVSGLNDETINAHVNQQVTLNCSLLTAEDWKQNKVQVMWYKNFTEKILDCKVDKGKTTNCQKLSSSSTAQLSPKIFDGNAALEFSNVQESDGGTYQCWVIFPQFYNKRYIALHVQGEIPMIGVLYWCYCLWDRHDLLK
ncbi:hypothetical protein XENTR_v10023478 [Xenopus tropicalis]|nr:hypothetical protein XENTR_v10023478 [Xenopus tropicalis]